VAAALHALGCRPVRRRAAASSDVRARLVAVLLATVALLAAGLASASLTVGALVLPPSQPGVNVYDFASIWSSDTRAAAQQVIDGIKTRTGAEVAVVSWPSGESSVSTGGAAVDARLIMDTWGVGRAGINDGLVVLFDMDTTNRHGQVYLATGSGYRDKYLSDAEAQSIVNGDMLPRAKDGDLDAALTDGLAHVDRVTQPGGNPERAFTRVVQIVEAGIAAVVVLGVLALFLRTWWRRGRDARTPLIDDSVLLPAPPPALTPALATVLRDDLVGKDAFSAALVDLGHRGLVTFSEDEGILNKLAHRVDLVVPEEPLSDANSATARERPLGVAEHGLYLGIAGRAVGGVIDSATLRSGTGRELWDDFKKHIGIAAASSGWFRDDPNQLVGRWGGIGIALAIASAIAFFVLASADESSPDFVKPGTEPLALMVGIGFLVGLGILFLSRRLAARTSDGAQVLAMSLAYRNTLRFELQQAKTIDGAVAATKSRLPWITTPDILTVWAVALGLNSEIDGLIRRTFEAAGSTGSGAYAPIWFSSSNGFGGIGGVSGLASSVASIATSSTSSSGGGFGGGGGGGGGGAGGGF
jgi:uncharacterized membrane protein YgcG